MPLDPHPLSEFEANNGGYPFKCSLIPEGVDLLDVALGRGLGNRALLHQLAEYGPAAAMIFRTIVCTIVLHRSSYTARLLRFPVTDPPRWEDADGIRQLTAGELKTLKDHAYNQWEKLRDVMEEQYKLNAAEMKAIVSYTDADKNVPQAPSFMGASASYGDFGTGWAALKSAISKLPTMAQLGIETLFTFRCGRTSEEIEGLKQAHENGSGRIVHGAKAMEMGQHHYMSTAITYNVHCTRVPDTRGVVGILGTSGVYVNFGANPPSVDGGEVLYKPGLITHFVGVEERAYQATSGGNSYDLVLLGEAPKVTDNDSYIDDHKFGNLTTAEVRNVRKSYGWKD